jgi:hypothetical protein
VEGEGWSRAPVDCPGFPRVNIPPTFSNFRLSFASARLVQVHGKANHRGYCRKKDFWHEETSVTSRRESGSLSQDHESPIKEEGPMKVPAAVSGSVTEKDGPKMA